MKAGRSVQPRRDQREPAAAGRARPVPPVADHRAAARRRDHARPARHRRGGAATTVGYGGGVEAGRRIVAPEQRRRRRPSSIDVAPRAFVRDRPPQPVRQEPIGEPVLQRQPPLAASSYDADLEYRAARHVPRAASVQHRRRCVPQRHARAAAPFELQLRAAQLQRRLARRLPRAVSVTGSYQMQRTTVFDEQLTTRIRTCR